MSRSVILIILITIIITISNLIMKILRYRDVEKGLVLEENNYSIKKTIFSSLDQDKRIEKQKKEEKEKISDSELWKKLYIISMTAAFLGMIAGIYFGNGCIQLTIIILFLIYIYKKRTLSSLILIDLYVLLTCLQNVYQLNIPVIVMAPFVILFNFLKYRDYKMNKNSR